MLDVRGLSATYGQHPALQDVSLTVKPGEIVVILGANGAGKSTLLRAIAGICEGHVTGDVALRDQSLMGNSSDEIVERGVSLVPEGRGIFGDLSVRENLVLGAYATRARANEKANLDRVLGLFPKLRERQGQIARTMSGGEQQMVAIGRAMMSSPDILMLDEPSLGLSPLLCKELFQNLTHVKKLGIGILLVEQNAKQSLAIADRGYLLENTRITHEDSAENLSRDPAVQKAYLGAGAKSTVRGQPEQTAVDEDTPQVTRISVRAQPRRTADQQVGLSIEDLVQGASATSVAASAPAASKPPVDLGPAHQSRLDAVLKEIETAAQSARTLRSEPRKSSSPVRHASSASAPAMADDGPPPVIEVYRRPRVEVYRRRASGAFERD